MTAVDTPQTSGPAGGGSGSADIKQVGPREIVHDYLVKVRGGDIGSLPAVLGLLTLIILFSILRPDSFLTSLNVANLINQSAAVVILSMGLVFVLLLGEIDLAAGYTAGTCAGVIGWAATNQGWPVPVALLLGLVAGVVIGAVMGSLVAYLGIPSFVVTLAFFLGLAGLLLRIVGNGKTISYPEGFLIDINNATLPVWLGWAAAIVGLAVYAGSRLLGNLRRRRLELAAEPLLLWGLKSVVLAVLVLAAVAYLSQERAINPAFRSLKGVPAIVLVVVGLLVLLTLLLNRTRWGRHVYAVGGNAEAARRAGINVVWVKVSCFMLTGALAAVAGLTLASRNNGVTGETGGANTLLLAVGAAVIGGTSLFGGKGRMVDAIIGGLLIAVIQNGLLILDQPANIFQMVTGGVLLLAATVDAVSRRRSAATGRG
ncbi:ABC transporter permease [Nocardioides marinquilinus]|uniref:Xylose transport system permease protein XylH n=1 Tax=Nocardioides marinquilinus TaxID=1210400 RepID=A0ABP9Q2R9_9ACTN